VRKRIDLKYAGGTGGLRDTVMIEPAEWSSLTHIGELACPFMRGQGERPLRLTLHSDSLAELSGEQGAAVQVLREFGHLPEIQVLETEPGGHPHIKVGDLDPQADFIPFQIVSGGEPQLYTSVPFPRQWRDIAPHLVGQSTLDHPDVSAMLDLLIIAQAHYSWHGDILVTSSPLLLKHRSKEWLREANPRTPLEAAKIVGLFLRSRDIYTYEAGPRYQRRFDRGRFYLVLACYRLPSMWRYFDACSAAEKVRGDDLGELGQSILVRSVRALEARDAIGVQFYMPQQDPNTQDQMMYHFDYLTLVLAGALDAQAIVANRAYQAIKKERYASFHYKDFRSALVKNGAQELGRLFADHRFTNLLTLLHEPRNTIHRAALRIITYQERSGPQHTFAEVPQPIGQKLYEAAEQLGGAEEWGLTSRSQLVWLEPYSYATALVRESLKTIDAVASTTNVARLFPVNQPIPSFKKGPPKDSVFKWGERVALLA
jgi:hypothetical protein